MKVHEFARQRGISKRRVRALIANGSVHATKHARAWRIDSGSAPKFAPSCRPLSAESRKALSAAIQTQSIASLEGQLRARTAKRVRALRGADNLAALLADWWGNVEPAIVDAASSMAARAVAGEHDSVREQLRRHPTRYLRLGEDLAETILTEPTIQGFSIHALAAKADVTPQQLRRIEQASPDKVRSMRRVLRALNLEPTALPTPQGER